MGWKGTRWPLWAVAGIAAATAAVLYVVWRSPHRDDYATYGDFFVATVVVIAPLLAWARRRSWGSSTDQESLDRAVEDLAVAVQAQWEAAAGERGLTGADPIHVTWASPSLAVARATTALSSRRFAPLPGLPPAEAAELAFGCVTDLHALYGGLGSGRLIVIGSPGSGKSGAAVLLIVAALRYRNQASAEDRKKIPVPMLFTAQDWDPDGEPVPGWLARQIRVTFPQLRRLASADAVQALMATGRIAVIIDGLDEVDPEMQPVALRALSQQASCRLVILARTDDMAAAAASHGLQGSATIELQPVSPAEAASYLERVQVAPAPKGWRDMIRHLRDNPASPLSKALDSPLALSLVRDTCESEDDTRELLAFAATLSDAPVGQATLGVTDYLLDRVLPAAYTRQPGQPPLPHDLVTAHRTLAKIAAQMDRQATRDLYWWLIPTWAPSTPRRITSGLVLGLAGGLALGLASVLATGLAGGEGGIVSVSLSGVSTTVLSPVISCSFTCGTKVALANGLARGLDGGLGTGLGVGLTFALALGLISMFQTAGGKPPRTTMQFRFRRTLGWMILASVLAVGFVSGLGLRFEFDSAFGIAGGSAAGLVFWLIVATTADPEDGNFQGPAASWRAQWKYMVSMMVVTGLVSGLSFGLVFATGPSSGLEIGHAFGLEFGLVFGLLLGLVLGLVFGLMRSEGWPTFLASFQIAVKWRSPLRLVTFLEDAHKRNVLRAVGPAYQFRHARLQDRLAAAAGFPGEGALPRAVQACEQYPAAAQHESSATSPASSEAS